MATTAKEDSHSKYPTIVQLELLKPVSNWERQHTVVVHVFTTTNKMADIRQAKQKWLWRLRRCQPIKVCLSFLHFTHWYQCVAKRLFLCMARPIFRCSNCSYIETIAVKLHLCACLSLSISESFSSNITNSVVPSKAVDGEKKVSQWHNLTQYYCG